MPRVQESFLEQVAYNRASSKSQQVTMNMRRLGVGCSPGRNFPGSIPLNQESVHPLGRLELMIPSRQWAAAVSTQLSGLKHTSAGSSLWPRAYQLFPACSPLPPSLQTLSQRVLRTYTGAFPPVSLPPEHGLRCLQSQQSHFLSDSWSF